MGNQNESVRAFGFNFGIDIGVSRRIVRIKVKDKGNMLFADTGKYLKKLHFQKKSRF